MPLTPPTVLLHGVWMKEYQGYEARPSFYAGGFKWPAELDWSHEMFNFLNIDGYCYGHVQYALSSGQPKQLNLQNLGVTAKDQAIEGVRVVWTAPARHRKGKAIVGWYDNATLYRYPQEHADENAKKMRTYKGEQFTFRVKAKARDCHLLPLSKRTTIIPAAQGKGSGWPGQAPVFYLNKATDQCAHIQAAIDDIVAGRVPRPLTKKAKRRVDVENNKRVEDRAIDHVTQHFVGLGYSVVSVEEQNLGYDLTAQRADITLCIEVKGRSVPDVQAEFSPNETKKMRAFEKGHFADGIYRICIVTDALTAPKLHDFEYVPEGRYWYDFNREIRLKAKEIVALRLEGV